MNDECAAKSRSQGASVGAWVWGSRIARGSGVFLGLSLYPTSTLNGSSEPCLGYRSHKKYTPFNLCSSCFKCRSPSSLRLYPVHTRVSLCRCSSEWEPKAFQWWTRWKWYTYCPRCLTPATLLKSFSSCSSDSVSWYRYDINRAVHADSSDIRIARGAYRRLPFCNL